tara:strand:+ start:2409 stop:2987 length:579 start_codon:yes stop_codon:yes gene_type:complete
MIRFARGDQCVRGDAVSDVGDRTGLGHLRQHIFPLLHCQHQRGRQHARFHHFPSRRRAQERRGIHLQQAGAQAAHIEEHRWPAGKGEDHPPPVGLHVPDHPVDLRLGKFGYQFIGEVEGRQLPTGAADGMQYGRWQRLEVRGPKRGPVGFGDGGGVRHEEKDAGVGSSSEANTADDPAEEPSQHWIEIGEKT